MNIRDLEYIRAVARTTHFGKAAKACNVSQPALSGRIKKVEDELGVKLFERDNRSVRLTEIGRQIVPLADEALKVVDNIRLTAESVRDPLSGQFKIGAIPTIAPYLIPHFVRQSRDALPGLKMRFQEDITERLNQALLNGQTDAAILATPPEHPKLDSIRLYDEPFWVIFPKGHSLTTIRGIKTKDLPVDELLLLTDGHCFRDQAMDVCKLGSAPEGRPIQATSLATLVNMVAAEQGITLVPAMAMQDGSTRDAVVTAEKLDDREAYRRIYLTYRKSYPRLQLIEKMADVIKANLPESVTKL